MMSIVFVRMREQRNSNIQALKVRGKASMLPEFRTLDRPRWSGGRFRVDGTCLERVCTAGPGHFWSGLQSAADRDSIDETAFVWPSHYTYSCGKSERLVVTIVQNEESRGKGVS
jgi:hypothetical protein